VVKTCVLLLAGGLAAQHTTLPVPSDLCIALLVASSCAMFRSRTRAPALFVFGFAMFMLAGLDILESRLEPAYEGDSMLAQVRVTDFPGVSGNSIVMDVEPVDDHRIPRRSRLSWVEAPVQPRIGDIWELELRLRQPRGSANPGVFDFEAWMFREKYHASGYVVGGKRNRLLASGAINRLERYRAGFVAATDAASESDSAAAILAAIGVGARHGISRQQWDNFAATGTSHLMAISGLHVGLAALAAFAVAFCLLTPILPMNGYAVAITVGLVCAFLYALVSGFGVPARRAVVMLAVAALTVGRRRQVDGIAAVAVAGVIVFLTDPIATMRPGFHLSFAAVVLLLWLARRKDVSGFAGRLLSGPRQLVVMQVFLLFGLFPLTALTFQRFAIAATPVNLVAVPVFSLTTVPLTLAAMLVSGVSTSLASSLLGMAALSVEGIERLIAWVVEWPFATISLAEVRGVAWLLVFVPLAWVILPRGWPGRRIALLGILAMTTWKPAPPPPDCFDTWVLDVGQGLAVVAQVSNGILLYDTGMAWRGGGSSAEQVVLPFLRSRGIGRIDWLVVSHSDLDHSGGTATIIEQLSVGELIVGESLALTDERFCLKGQGWSSGGIDFDLLHPRAPNTSQGNASSCVLRISAGPHSLLLTGDIEADSERVLVQARAQLAADIVVVPHHGSMTSSIVPFIDSVYPDLAVVSAGFGNRWGFPKEQVVRRWEAMGAEVLNTATSGAVHFRVCTADGVSKIRAERELRRRFWHART